MAKARRKEGLLWECLHPAHVGDRMRPRGWFGRSGKGEEHRHSHCRECRREGKSAQAARRRGAGVMRIPAGWLVLLLNAQNGCCAICGRWLGPQFHVDHKVPVSRGGRHKYRNLAIAHVRENQTKSKK